MNKKVKCPGLAMDPGTAVLTIFLLAPLHGRCLESQGPELKY